MQQPIIFTNFWTFAGIQMISQIVRYTLLAGGAFFAVWVLGRQKYAARKIQKTKPSNHQIKSEIKRSLLTGFVFSLVGASTQFLHRAFGWFRFYPDFHSRGLGYAIFSVLAVILIHDTYLYWMHRFMHIPAIYKRVHLVHHMSYSPTPFTIYSFHPLEAVLEALIIPIAAFIVPLHFYSLIVFSLYSVLFNVIGHLGHELYGKRFEKSGLFEVMTTTTHHDLHHHQAGSNFGFYFRFWDRFCGTENPKYAEKFFEKAQLSESWSPVRNNRQKVLLNDIG